MSMHYCPAAFMGLAIAFSGSVLAQELAWTITGQESMPSGGARILGYKMAAIGDIDGDGHEDLVTIARGTCNAAEFDYLWIVSGSTGALIREVLPPPPQGRMHYECISRAGDWNSDGTPDYIAGAWHNLGLLDIAVVRSGLDDSILATLPSVALQVLSDLDVDGDGRPDAVVGWEYGANWWGQVDVYSNSGQLLYRLTGDPNASPPLGIANCFARLNDIDDDGADDFVMGCYDMTASGSNVIVSGRTGATIRICSGQPGDVLCEAVANCGDVDGDGYEDFAASSASNSGAAINKVRVFSSRTGQVLQGWDAVPSLGAAYRWGFSYQLGGGVDLDGDGVPDVVSGGSEWVSTSERGVLYAWSGRDGSLIARVVPHSVWMRIGNWSTALRAGPGDETGLFLVSDDLWANGVCATLKAIHAYRGLPRTSRRSGAACAGTLSSPPQLGMRSLGAAGVRVHLSGAPPGAPAILMLGLSATNIYGIPLPLALDPLGFPNCALRTSIDAQFLAMTGTAGSAAGYVHVDVPHPVPASGQGLWTLAGQWVVLGAGSEFPGGLTQGITWRR
jgi:hypothetical protein